MVRELPSRFILTPIQQLPLGALGDLDHQSHLTRVLGEATPNYLASPLTSAAAFLDHPGAVTSLPVVLRSFGNTASGVAGCL